MRRRIFLTVSVFALTILHTAALRAGDSLYFFRSDKVFKPSESAVFEARNGFTKFIDKKFLKLDIGVSFDLIGLKSKSGNFSFGADFFTFSNLRNESNFKFPVDAIDYFFGVNFNYATPVTDRLSCSSRLRISHISSHFEDGHVYERSDTIFTPVVFSKEFVNLAGRIDYNLSRNFWADALLALNYVFHAIPSDMKGLSGDLGLETRYFVFRSVSFYASNTLTVQNVNSDTNVNESFEGGVTFGEKDSRSVDIFFSYYDGQDYRGQYYGGYLNYTGLGAKFNF